MENYIAKEGVWVAGDWYEAGQPIIAAPKAVKYKLLSGQVERVELKKPAPAPAKKPAKAAD